MDQVLRSAGAAHEVSSHDGRIFVTVQISHGSAIWHDMAVCGCMAICLYGHGMVLLYTAIWFLAT